MIKKLWKSAAVKVWSIVSFVVIILFLVVTILSTTAFYELFNLVMPGGGPRAVYAEGIEPIYVSDYDNKADVYAAARDMNREICEEGMVLLKNSEISAGKKALPTRPPFRIPR